jgi:hypothetical protein
MNLKHAAQSEILIYNYLITGVALVGLLFNIIMLNTKRRKVGERK